MSRPREKRFQTHRNRWGPGRVHRYLYDRTNRLWYVTCSPSRHPHGEAVAADTPITCRKCDPTLPKDDVMPNYEALRTGAQASETPADGNHQATLDRAALVDTNNGERLVTDWTDVGGRAAWTSWNRFDESGWSYTIELLDGLGVDRSKMKGDGDLERELERVTGHVYDVRTSSQMGRQGDRVFVSTYVDGKALGVQEALTSNGDGDADVPIDTSDLQPAKAKDDDDDVIPF